MPPKKSDVEKAVEGLQRDVGKIADQERSLEEMKKQMSKLSVLERLEQRLIEEAEAKKRSEGMTMVSEQLSSQIGTSRVDSIRGEGSREEKGRDPPSRVEPILVEEMEREAEMQSFPPHAWKPPEQGNGPLTRRIEVPLFDGSSAEQWVMRVEQYFELENLTEEEKLKAVRISYVDEALMWYRWERQRNPFQS
ncbi:hypothetical protein EUTSA_v10002674mg [Eutrema salsugineum]|uniref:Retrotransposon gag domain-containing protein n=1 Tax=Eutrema salsugineum TaxID=72664 RepID=V4KZZ4_EUTSA|nr:hypothetical protein EUTSA_v10002674mg [Eutrema salsugineum]